MDKTDVLKTGIPPFPVLVNTSINPQPKATIEYWHLRQAASKVWCGRDEMVDAQYEIVDAELRERLQTVIEAAAKLASSLDERARLVNDEGAQDRCTCNGTEPVACSYCRAHPSDAIPF